MRDYNYRKNWNDLLTPEIVKKLTLIHEYKGEQRLFIEAHKDELKELVEIAKVQSTEASNKIEGISTADDRLKNLVQAKTTPRNRDESEIAGYRDVLNTIHENSRIEKAKKSKEAVAATKNELEKEQQKSAKQELDLKKLIAENASLRDELSARRQEQQPTYVPKPLDLSEYKTRKLYIDSMLTDAGWTEGEDWLNEVELSGMPNKSETGFADYVLYDDMHRPLAVIEAKRTCVDVSKGRQQAKLYADLLEHINCERRGSTVNIIRWR